MPFQRLGDILPETIERLGLGAGVQRARVLLLWPEVSAAVLPGAEAASRAVGLRAGVLHILVRSPGWNQELHARRRNIVGEVNRRMGREVVRDVEIRVGALTPP